VSPDGSTLAKQEKGVDYTRHEEVLLRGTAIAGLCLLFFAVVVRLARLNVAIAAPGWQPGAAQPVDASLGVHPDSVSDTGIRATLSA
jgi:hypothetical protein